MIWKATMKWGAFCGNDPLETRTSIRFNADNAKDANRLAREIIETNPDWMLESVQLQQE